MVQETSRNLTQAENLQRHVFLKLANADINTSDISCLLNGRKHIGPEETQKQYLFFGGGGGAGEHTYMAYIRGYPRPLICLH